MPRLFISINCNDETKKQLISVQEKIKAQSEKGNYSRPENLHLTLAFLGETPQEQVEAIRSCMNEILKPPAASFYLAFSQTGFFRRGNKELWWIGVDHKDSSVNILNDLRQRITSSLSSKKIYFDNKDFKPHITLGREITHNARERSIIIPEQKIIYPVNRISLMKSEHISRTLVYTEIYGANLEFCK